MQETCTSGTVRGAPGNRRSYRRDSFISTMVRYMANDDDRIVSVDQLPEAPLKMPPPYWRGGGAIFHLDEALRELERLLQELIPIHAKTEVHLDEYYEKHPEENPCEEVLEEFAEITAELGDMEYRIKLKAELACLMSAIETEDNLNQFCVFNLHKDIAESIEKLSPPEKLLIAAAAVGRPGVKDTSVFEAIRRLSAWRNAFAHGHCVDRPTKSLRHNHLIPPNAYPGIPSALAEMRELVGAFLRVSDYLKTINMNPYTKGESTNVEEIRESLTRISRYRFDGNNYVYDVTISEAEQQKVVKVLTSLAESGDERQTTKLENILATLDPIRGRLLGLELGIEGGRPRSRKEIMRIMKISSRDLAKERAIALTRLAGVVDFLAEEAF
jgi:hypothetical protein